MMTGTARKFGTEADDSRERTNAGKGLDAALSLLHVPLSSERLGNRGEKFGF
jgi:hypothetical protein